MADPSSENPPNRPSTVPSSSLEGKRTSAEARVGPATTVHSPVTSSSQTITIVTKEGIRWEGPALPSQPPSVLPMYQDTASGRPMNISVPTRCSTLGSPGNGPGALPSSSASLPVSASGYNPRLRVSPQVIFKEDFDYEGRTRIEKEKDKLLLDYDAYLQSHHTEITHLLQDIVLNLLIHQPERPLKDIRSYVRSRKGL